MGLIDRYSRRFSLNGTVLLLILFSGPHGPTASFLNSAATCEAAAQEECPPTTITEGNETTITHKLSLDGCQVTPGTYTNKWVSVRVDARGTSTGHCTKRAWGGLPQQCQVTWDGDRTVSGLGIRRHLPNDSYEYTLGSISPIGPADQDLDSEAGDSTGPKYATTLGHAGEHKVHAQTFVYTTPCAILPTTSEKKTIAFNVVSCLPAFSTSPQNQIVRVPNDGTTIKINTSSAPIITALDASIPVWNSVLNSHGVNVQFQRGACFLTDPHCIQIYPQADPGFPGNCGLTRKDHYGPDGIVTRGIEIFLHQSYLTDPEYVKYITNHELGHTLGLGNSPLCPQGQQSVMLEKPPSLPCGIIPTGAKTLPDASNALPIDRTAYDGGTRNTCPPVVP